MHILTAAGRAFGAVGAILYPPLCPLCLHASDPARAGICPACRGSMRRVGADHPLVREGERKLACAGELDGFLTLYLFEKSGPVQLALHLLKYSGMHSLGVWFGRDLGAAFASDGRFSGAPLLVPVPLHPARLRERGFNQAERICTGIAQVTGARTVPGALARARNTRSQTTLSLHEREQNVRDAFRTGGGRVWPPAVGGKGKSWARKAVDLQGATIVLVDDVMTTGSTLASCAKALRQGGACSILAATVAVADH